MKNFKIILFSFTFILAGFAFTSCNSSSAKAKDGKEYTSAYICPMHCPESGSDSAGKCPVCTMDYVANKDYKAEEHNHDGHDHGSEDGHDHDHSHGGHDHGSHDGHDH